MLFWVFKIGKWKIDMGLVYDILMIIYWFGEKGYFFLGKYYYLILILVKVKVVIKWEN